MEFLGKDNEYLRLEHITPQNSDIISITRERSLTVLWFESGINELIVDGEDYTFKKNQMVFFTEFHKVEPKKIDAIRKILGYECGISSDMIAGFCTETEEEHQDTLSLMDYAQYDFSYMFVYSERPGTLAEKKYKDDIPEEIKKRRLSEIIDKQQELSLARNQKDLNKVHKVLVEGVSKRSKEHLQGRNSANKVVQIWAKAEAVEGSNNELFKDFIIGIVKRWKNE